MVFQEAYGIKDTEKEDTESYTYQCNKKVYDKIWKDQAKVKMRCQVGGSHCEEDWEKFVPEFMEFCGCSDSLRRSLW